MRPRIRCKTVLLLLLGMTTAAFVFLISRDVSGFEKCPCNVQMLKYFNTSRLLLWDANLARIVKENRSCTEKELESLTSVAILSSSRRDRHILTFEDHAENNFYLIRDTVTRGIYKAIWKDYGAVSVPENLTAFEAHWSRSTMLSCRNITMPGRNSTEARPFVASDALKSMENLVFDFLKYGVHLFMTDGTLLGWYRECSFIPYTSDVDMAFIWNEYNPQAFEAIVKGKTNFKPWYRYGFHGKDLEYTLLPRSTGEVRIDVFEVNEDEISQFTSSFAGQHVFQYRHPKRFDPFCAADFHGYLFWLTCNPDVQLRAYYGQWWKGVHQKNYDYVKSSTNSKEAYVYKATDDYFKNYRSYR